MRLTNYTREKIVKALVSRSFKDRDEALKHEEEALGDRVYRYRVSAELEKALNAANDILPGAANTTSCVYATPSRNIGYMRLGLSTRRVQPSCGLEYRFDENIGTLNDEIADWVGKVAKLAEDKHDATVKADAVLGACNTLKQLEARWPDVMPIVRELLPQAPVANLPAVPVAELNEIFDLPVEQKEAA